jgi:hypothetical protein
MALGDEHGMRPRSSASLDENDDRWDDLLDEKV